MTAGARSSGASFRRSGSCGRGRDERAARCGRRGSPCGRGNRDGASEPDCSADRCASSFIPQKTKRIGRDKKGPPGRRPHVRGRPIGKRERRVNGRGGGIMVLKMVERNVGSRSEEHTSELQSLMRISYAVFCLKKKKTIITIQSL